jgi:predicted ATPase
MPTISEITLLNYKSFRNLENFPLKPLNILIGRNGAGKSNFINFFKLLSAAADERLTTTIRAEGGLSEIRWRHSRQDDSIDWRLTLKGLDIPRPSIYYGVSLIPQGNNFNVRLEEVSADPNPGFREEYKFLGAYNGTIRYLTAKPGTDDDVQLDGNQSTEEVGYDYNSQELAIAQIRDPIRYPLMGEIRHLFTDCTIFRGFGENALANIYNSQSLDVVSPLRLDSEGSNLVSVLHAVYNDGRYIAAQDELESILRQAFPDFRKLAFNLTASGKAELQWRNTFSQFPASQVSDGMLRFLGLATLLLLPDPPALIAIDEPEIGLHPELIPLLGGLLKSASQRTQIIVATHSPQLLNAVMPEDVVIVESHNGETRLERPDSDNLKLWLERYTLGSLWTMGKLEHA